MFDKIKKLLGGKSSDAEGPASRLSPASALPLGATAFGQLDLSGAQAPSGSPGAYLDFAALQRWSQQHKVHVAERSKTGPAFTGEVRGKPWRIEIAHSSRQYITGHEIRARAELDLNDDAVVLVMTRALKEQLEKSAFSVYTDPLQTTVDPKLPEEMRWLAMYEEVGWEALGMPFFEQFAILASSKADAESYLTPTLAQQFLAWAEVNTQPLPPMLLMVMRGKSYLRLAHSPPDVHTLQAAHLLFVTASAAAIDGLSTDLAL